MNDFQFENDNLTIRVQSSKTDFLRAGADVFIAANTERVSCCPVRTSRAYFQKLKAIGFTRNRHAGFGRYDEAFQGKNGVGSGFAEANEGQFVEFGDGHYII